MSRWYCVMHSASTAGVIKAPASVSLACGAALFMYSNGAALPGGVLPAPAPDTSLKSRTSSSIDGNEDATADAAVDASAASASRAAHAARLRAPASTMVNVPDRFQRAESKLGGALIHPLVIRPEIVIVRFRTSRVAACTLGYVLFVCGEVEAARRNETIMRDVFGLASHDHRRTVSHLPAKRPDDVARAFAVWSGPVRRERVKEELMNAFDQLRLTRPMLQISRLEQGFPSI